MRFDSNRAWQEATALISANRDVLWALAGVFLVLPSFAVGVLAPPPRRHSRRPELIAMR